MNKSLITTWVGVFICLSSLLAQKLPKTLLWRISGNGLEKPSYLYGTMHVYDPRLFNLGDSLLQAISSSEGFANELDLNQITPMIVEIVKQQIRKSLTLKEMLSKKAFEQYGPALSKKLNEPADQITSLDILKEKNKWIDEGYKGKKMQTFLDAYLADLAYRQGKWIGGVEDFSDQSGLLNSVIDESDIKQLVLGAGQAEKSEMENMITIYQNSDLDGFQKLLNGMDSNYRDILLIKRNRKMVGRMDSLAHIRSMVFAVGAAHLPGEDGLISLLRAKGYIVSPVFYSKKIDSKSYSVPEITKPWVEVNDPEGHYKVLMPGTPGDIKLYGVVSMEMYFNIFNSTWYMSASFGLPYAQKGLDSVQKTMLKELFGAADFKEEKVLDINGIPGKSYVQKNADGYKKVYLFYKDNLMYYAVAFSASDKENSLQSVDKFFNSYQPIPISKDQYASHYMYVDSANAYRISLPSKPKTVDDLPVPDKSSLKTNLMISSDPQSGSYYFFGSSESKMGFAYQNDSTLLSAVHDNLLKKFQDITRDTSYSLNDRRILEMDGSMLNGSMRTKTKIIFKGNRYYTLLIMYGPGKWNGTAGEVFKSFELLDYAPSRWENKVSPDSLFSAWVPARIYFYSGKDRSDEIKSVRYESFDSSRANTYSVKADTLEKYFWEKSDSAMWNKQKSKYVDRLDTVLSERIFKKDGMYQYEFFKKPRGANNILRMQMILRGSLVYRLTTVQEPGSIRDENVNRYFNNFRFNHPPPDTRVFDSKAIILLKDLQSGDSAIRKKANESLPDAPFDRSETDLLQEAIRVTYPLDSNRNKTTNQLIAERIIELNDSSSVVFARNLFSSASQPDIQNALLGILSSVHTRENYTNLGRLLLSSPPNSLLPRWVTNKWYDSLQLAACLFPTILPLLKDSLLVPEILDIASDLLDSNIIQPSIFTPWQGTILNYSDQRYKTIMSDSLNYSGADYSLLNILGMFKNTSSNIMLKKWLRVKNHIYLKQQVVLSLLANSQSPGNNVLLELAANRSTRIDLYQNLKKYKQSALFPAKYLTQSYFAESLADKAASELEDEETDMTFITIKEMKWNGKISRFFFYNVFLEEDNEQWLAVSGPFKMNRTDISLSEAKSDMYTTEQYDVSTSAKQMKALVEQMERDK